MKQIVFIHGLNCSPQIFLYLHIALPKHNAIFISYDSFNPVEDSYSDILRQMPSDNVSIVGHSLGGIMGHLLATRQNGLNVNKLVTISSPYGGSHTAGITRFILPRLQVLHDLTPTSKIIREVTTSSVSDHMSIISTAGSMSYVLGGNDGIVSIRSQERAPTQNKIKIATSHFEVVQHGHTTKNITNFLF